MFCEGKELKRKRILNSSLNEPEGNQRNFLIESSASVCEYFSYILILKYSELREHSFSLRF